MELKLPLLRSLFNTFTLLSGSAVGAIGLPLFTFELDSASLMGFNGRKGRKLVPSASGFGKKSMIFGHCTKIYPFNFMYGGFFILALVAV